jgi:predicted dehydrogenase
MVGGGPGSGVGELHRDAAKAAGLNLVAGCFSRDPARNRAAAPAFGLAPDRVHDDVHMLVRSESQRPDGARLLVICTPHVLHLEAAAVALAHGWRAVIEKPLCTSADELRALAARGGVDGNQDPDVALPLVMRYMPGLQRLRLELAAGEIGTLRWLTLEYLQGRDRQGMPDWRFARGSAGPGGTVADLGPHAWDLCHWLTGQEPVLRAADLRTLDPQHELDDSAWVWLDLGADARAQVTLCQAAVGAPADCRIRLFGMRGMREWRMSNESDAAGGIASLFRQAFGRFYLDVARWHGQGSTEAGADMARWADGARAVRLTLDSLNAPGQTINKVA